MAGRTEDDNPQGHRAQVDPGHMADSTNVGFYFTPKGGSKSAVQIQHGKLKDEADVQARKAFWQAALARLAEAVGETGG